MTLELRKFLPFQRIPNEFPLPETPALENLTSPGLQVSHLHMAHACTHLPLFYYEARKGYQNPWNKSSVVPCRVHAENPTQILWKSK